MSFFFYDRDRITHNIIDVCIFITIIFLRTSSSNRVVYILHETGDAMHDLNDSITLLDIKYYITYLVHNNNMTYMCLKTHPYSWNI